MSVAPDPPSAASKLRSIVARYPVAYAAARAMRSRVRRARSDLATRADRLARPFARSERLSSAYFGLVSGPFGREHRAVLAGKQEFLQRRAEGRERYVLRRNVHMLEKGLVMRPRRDTFALDYIQETVVCFRSLLDRSDGACQADPELQWANDVLSWYFDVAASHPAVDRAQANFERLPLGLDPRATTPGLRPYRRDLARPATVDYTALLELAQRRRSVRWFEQRPVPRELIDKALLVAGLSPSACNRQPFEFRVFDDPKLVREVAEIPMGTRGWVDNIPAFVVIVGSLAAFFSERDRHLIYTDGCLAAMAFLFALESLGLSSCCVNWPDIAERERRMAKILGLEPHQRPVMCIAIGYADTEGMVPFSQKKPASQIGRYNRE